MAVVRSAHESDADAIGRIQVESWKAAYAGLLPDETIAAFDVAARQQMWREGLARVPRPGSATFVAVADEHVIGFATVGASHSEHEAGELYAIYVHPASWGNGAGRLLIGRAEQSLRDSGFRHALLWVLTGNDRAERFYRAAGWARDGEKQDTFQGAEVVELRYRKTFGK
jgi:GNAT superfamily N-acetyltransferase